MRWNSEIKLFWFAVTSSPWKAVLSVILAKSKITDHPAFRWWAFKRWSNPTKSAYLFSGCLRLVVKQRNRSKARALPVRSICAPPHPGVNGPFQSCTPLYNGRVHNSTQGGWQSRIIKKIMISLRGQHIVKFIIGTFCDNFQSQHQTTPVHLEFLGELIQQWVEHWTFQTKHCRGFPEPDFLCISLNFSAFLCVSLNFSAFLCISLHFSKFLCISDFVS